ncbi:MFS transporter [Arcanobacterium haemolyticum]|nr:MFS transporter [Arcanobacterium haemolyticum]
MTHHHDESGSLRDPQEEPHNTHPHETQAPREHHQELQAESGSPQGKSRTREANPLRPLALPVYIPALIYAIGDGAIKPVIVLAALSIGFTDAGSSAVVGLFGLVGVFTAPPLGRLISRIGDRKALVGAGIVTIGAIILSLASLIVGNAHPAFARSSFIISLVIIAIGANIWALGRQAYVAEHVDASWRARGLSTLGGMTRLGDLVGPGFSTLLIGMWFLGSVFWLALIMTAISTLMVVVFLVPPAEKESAVDILATEENPSAPASQAPAITEAPRPTVVRSVFATVVMGIGLNAIAILRANRNVIVPLWGAFLGVDETVITATFAISALVDSIMFFAVGGLMDRHGRLAALIPSLLVMPAGIVTMLLWQDVVGFVVGACILGIGNGFGAGVVMTTGADLSPTVNRATFLGLWQAIVNIGTAAGPFIASGMTHVLGVGASLWATAGIGVAGALWLTLLIRSAYERLGIDLRGRPLPPRHQQ